MSQLSSARGVKKYRGNSRVFIPLSNNTACHPATFTNRDQFVARGAKEENSAAFAFAPQTFRCLRSPLCSARPPLRSSPKGRKARKFALALSLSAPLHRPLPQPAGGGFLRARPHRRACSQLSALGNHHSSRGVGPSQ